ncbi:MAG: bifunctional ADP-dependent NAD(P)H-hydrate dehydratase/NAD(P)H-hydrate epimerase [Verrucomicrobia bacterium]|nr:MAG: bifunctional ADP-dependent NAD(P)H-hydrate dehydratase/NAD(P)H-hydrate epimerase [Verrucomicrobiota bacterium]
MLFADREQMRELDRITITDLGIPGMVLMERAGRGVGDQLLRLLNYLDEPRPVVLFAAGKGNNGGDAFCAARYLARAGVEAVVWLAGKAAEIRGDARKHLEMMLDAGVRLEERTDPVHWRVDPDADHATVVVDGLLGTGFTGDPREPVRSAIALVNELGRDRPVVAIDLPSGLDATEGVTQEHIVRADLTVTMGLPKKGFLHPEALEYIGSVEVVDIGVPPESVPRVCGETTVEMISATEVRRLFPPRKKVSHKGDYGKLLIIGGSRKYSGAVTMAARAAIRSGAGLVTLLVSPGVAPFVRAAGPEIMVETAPEDESGALSPELWGTWRDRLADFDALLLGPGLGRGEGVHSLVRNIIRDLRIPAVVDADAISVMAGQPHWFDRAQAPVVMTPHPGELARLLSEDIEAIQADRPGAAVRAAELTDATVVLKGAGTIVARSGRTPFINLGGNPGMATGGSGDVLAGLLAGFLAQGKPAFEAACAAVFLHSKAGDIAAWKYSQAAMTAMDICEQLPASFKSYWGP